jgi:SPP1 family predicted phage head-tail adaptor
MNISGKLRHIVNIQSLTNTQDVVTGEVTQTWVNTHIGVRASIEPLSAREFIQSRTDQSAISVRITIRYLSGLDASMRILGGSGAYDGRTFNPQGFLEDKKSGMEYVTIPCSEGVNDG